MAEDLPDWRELQQRTTILDEPQFSRADALAVLGITAKALEHMLDPKKERVRLDGRYVNPGTGRRRMFTGSDILKLATAHVMSAIGFPMRWSYLLADQIALRAVNRIIGLADPRHLGLALYPHPISDDWALVPILDGEPDSPLPLACQALDVDRLIDETLAKLTAIVEKRDIPSFDVPIPAPPPSPYSPENDFFRMWTKDEQGRDVLVGLTHAETGFYQQRLDKSFPDYPDRDAYLAAGERWRELHSKHEMARFARLRTENPAFYGNDGGDQ